MNIQISIYVPDEDIEAQGVELFDGRKDLDAVTDFLLKVVRKKIHEIFGKNTVSGFRFGDLGGFRFFDTPYHNHDCEKCRFIRSIGNDRGKRIDIYESCQEGDQKCLIRFSSDAPDYVTTGIEMLAISYAITHNPDWRE